MLQSNTEYFGLFAMKLYSSLVIELTVAELFKSPISLLLLFIAQATSYQEIIPSSHQ